MELSPARAKNILILLSRDTTIIKGNELEEVLAIKSDLTAIAGLEEEAKEEAEKPE